MTCLRQQNDQCLPCETYRDLPAALRFAYERLLPSLQGYVQVSRASRHAMRQGFYALLRFDVSAAYQRRVVPFQHNMSSSGLDIFVPLSFNTGAWMANLIVNRGNSSR